MKKNHWSVKLENFASKLGEYEILTEPEDIYVYSHYGIFGTKKIGNVVGVMRSQSPLKNETIKKLEDSTGLQIIYNTNQDEWAKLDNDKPVLIIDNTKPHEPERLIHEIKKLTESNTANSRVLREIKPMRRWVVNKIHSYPHYREGSQRLDTGYCVTESGSESSETLSSKGRLLLCKGLFNKELEVTDRLIQAMYRCTTCGQCYDDVQEDELRINNAIVRARHEIAKKRGKKTPLRPLVDNIHETGNPSGMPHEDRELWYEDIANEHRLKNNETLYWTGCTTSYRLPEVVEATVKIFNMIELDFGLLGNEEICCGLTLYLAGYLEQAAKLARTLVRDFKKRKVKRIVTSCAGCYYAFSRIYRELGIEIGVKVLHTSQLFDELTREGRLRVKGCKGCFMWHDPCDLGRHSGVYEPPRRVLSSIPGLKMVEPTLNRRHALCCGGGGGLMAYDYDLSKEIAESKYRQDIIKSGVDGVITGCPACIINLRGAVKGKKQVVDISQIILESI